MAIDRLTDVIGTIEDVTNMLKRVPPLEAKTKAVDQLMKDMHNKIEKLEKRAKGTENVLKKIANQICSILK